MLYREEHDKKHYESLVKDLTYSEVASMAYARVGVCRNDLNIVYGMRNSAATVFIAEPRVYKTNR